MTKTATCFPAAETGPTRQSNPCATQIAGYGVCQKASFGEGSWDLVTMVTEAESSIEIFNSEVLLSVGWCSASECDKVLAQFKAFSLHVSSNHKAEIQDLVYSCRLDEFLGRFVSFRAEHAALWDLMKCLLTLSHKQAAVERSESVNKDMLVENLKQRTLGALRSSQDAIASIYNRWSPYSVLQRSMDDVCAVTGGKMRRRKKTKLLRKDLHHEMTNVKAKQNSSQGGEPKQGSHLNVKIKCLSQRKC